MDKEKQSARHDADIHTLALVNERINSTPGLYFILTGSYSIEALTQTPLEHHDMDANIFAFNLEQAKAKAKALTTEVNKVGERLQRIKETPDRLEFELQFSNREQAASRWLEIRFVEVDGVAENEPLLFNLGGDEKGSQVPTVFMPLKDSTKREHVFRVKSLPYAIATWAIRISGLLDKQKRPLKKSDLDNFSLLLEADYSDSDVLRVMNRHPQMLSGVSEREIFDKAVVIVTNRPKN